MTEKKTFIVGWPETEEYDYENQPENIGTVRKLTDGEIVCPSDISGLRPDRNGGFEHKCTRCGEGTMKEYDQRHDNEMYNCTHCGATVQIELAYIVHIT